MAIIAKDDIILQTGDEFNFTQGTEQSYEFFLYKDFVGTGLNLYEPTSFHVAIYRNDVKYLQYSLPSTMGVSDSLVAYKDENSGRLSFTITPQQSLMIPPGEVFMQVTVMYENFYPQPKVYVFQPVKLGESLQGTGGVQDPDNNSGGSGSGGSGSEGTSSIFNGSTFMVEAVIGDMYPTSAGRLTLNNYQPNLVTSIIFRNLDEKGARITLLENFLKNRIALEGVKGTLTLTEIGDTNMYAIYKIKGWERVDIVVGDGDDQHTDGIKVSVELEDIATGPGVTRSTFVVGQKLTYSLDASGIGQTSISDGIGTYVDKNINPVTTTGNNAATGITITYSPYYDSYVMVEVNGISVEIGDGTKDKAAYFSGNGGTTATTIEEIRTGDQLIWNGSIAGYDLEVGDSVNLIYEVDVDDLR